MVVVTGVWQYKASFRARGSREEATDGLQAGGGLGHASRRMELRGGDGRSRGRRRRRLGLQPRRASRDRVRPWRGLQALLGRGSHPSRARHHHRSRRHDLAHRRLASHGETVHGGGKAAADARRSRHAIVGARRQAVQPAHPRGDLARTGEIYVSDGYGNSRVHKYDPTGRLLKSWGAPGTDPGCFNIPHNIATDAGGRVYVADRENSRVQIFDEDGRYLDQWKNLHRPCGLAAAARLGDLFFVGELPSHLPVNQAVPNIGARVSVLSIKGDLVERIGGPFAGEKPGEFVAPHGCAVDSRGDLYVAEVSWTAAGKNENPPREIRSLQKFMRT